MATKPEILIVGAGIGGLTAAIALRQAGFGAQVFERAAELKEIGAGIGLSANALRVLKHLGLMHQVVRRGAAIEAAVTYTSKGRTLSRIPMEKPRSCLVKKHAPLHRIWKSSDERLSQICQLRSVWSFPE